MDAQVSDIIGAGAEVFTNEELTRRIQILQQACDVLAARLEALDGLALTTVAKTTGIGISTYPRKAR